jgi:hypothetical protein
MAWISKKEKWNFWAARPGVGLPFESAREFCLLLRPILQGLKACERDRLSKGANGDLPVGQSHGDWPMLNWISIWP